MSSLRRLKLFGLLAVLPACFDSSGPTSPAELPTVRAITTSPVMRVGEPLSVEVSVTNRSAAPLELFVPLGWLEINDARGNVVASGRFRVESMIKLSPQRLAPSASVSDTFVWSGERTDGAGTQVLPGEYQLRAVVYVYGFENAIAYSEPVKVAVTR